MQRPDPMVLRDAVLVGGGHSHAVLLRDFCMRPLPGLRLTLVCNDVYTPYSGMLPGYVAGHYTFDEVHIDLARLCGFAGARLITAEATGIDRAARRLVLRDRPSIAYDTLSINIGSTPQWNHVPGARAHALPVKPIFQFNQRWLALLERVRRHTGRSAIAVVGGGAGGVELLLAMQYRLHAELRALGRDPHDLVFHLFSADPHVLPTHNRWVQGHFEAVLRARGVQVHRGAAVTEVEAGRLRTTAGDWIDVDETVWVTRAGGAAWLRDTGLALDKDGFIQVDDCLRSVSDPLVFAAGDVASMQGRALEKAGVFAVRMGRPLAENLRRGFAGKALLPYRPQKHWLALISTGDRYAVASRGFVGFAGRWVWRWKDWIDRRFMDRLKRFVLMPAAEAPVATSVEARLSVDESVQVRAAYDMRCGGCGAKVSASVLTHALAGLRPVPRDDVLMGLHESDDAAIVRVPPGKAMVHSVDFFRAFHDDPYLFGKIAANHALGDIYAMGAEAQSATAIATVPPGLDDKVGELLRQMMSGAVEVLNDARCALVGGHTSEGRELALGFAVNGLIDENLAGVLRKGGMRVGDALVLTKPIGTGTLLAAHARLAAQGRWLQQALASMLLSSRLASECLRRYGASACTDVTGFGLFGHLLEMTHASGVAARIELSALPLLEGALECVGAGIVSSLQAANTRLAEGLRGQSQFARHPRVALLFDPQTAGGLLASVPAENVAACVAALREMGYAQAALIGAVVALDVAAPSVLLSD